MSRACNRTGGPHEHRDIDTDFDSYASSWVRGELVGRQAKPLVPRTRSSHTSCGKRIANFGFKGALEIIELLVSLDSESSHPSVPRHLANFGIGTLVAAFIIGGRFDLWTRPPTQPQLRRLCARGNPDGVRLMDGASASSLEFACRCSSRYGCCVEQRGLWDFGNGRRIFSPGHIAGRIFGFPCHELTTGRGRPHEHRIGHSDSDSDLRTRRCSEPVRLEATPVSMPHATAWPPHRYAPVSW